MTALPEYERLESVGLWRPAPGEQRREVYVSFGDESLILRDRAETPLAHWSLAAVERRNPGAMPAVFSPGPDSGETLEIEDELMAGAIAKVQRLIRRRRTAPTRRRLAALALGLIALAVAG
ncbi:MAG: hypothetical protein D6832_04585, partial [Alphaproteobacteria bacterium]